MTKVSKFGIFILFISLICSAHCLKDGMNAKPPMGWTSRAVGCGINESLIEKIGDRLITSGLAGKGYQYVRVNDCWQGSRDQVSSRITSNARKFPSGIKALVGSMKNKGLKLGLGSDIGPTTCANQPGSYNFQQQDVQTYTDWQIDYIQYTNCNNLTNPKLRYYLNSKYLNESGSSIFYSIDNMGNDRTWEWASAFGNSWTTIKGPAQSWLDVVAILEKQVGLENYATAGRFNDPGQLLITSQKLTKNQLNAHFSHWCMLKAPLFFSADPSTLSPQVLQILGNQELIAINQDQLGIQAKRVKSQIGSQFKREVWAGPLQDGNQVISFLNRGQTDTTISVSLKNDLSLQINYYTERDPIRHINAGISNNDMLSFRVPPHSVEVRIVSAIKQPHFTFQ